MSSTITNDKGNKNMLVGEDFNMSDDVLNNLITDELHRHMFNYCGLSNLF
ncbi:MAG: hypothetical protein E6055_18895 [Clostridioides difficile]|nr:hypothetical protein [Clostridioides difficile]